MNLIGVIILFVVVGVALWLINTYVPMEANIKKLMNIAVVVLLVLWLLFGILGDANIAMPHIGLDRD